MRKNRLREIWEDGKVVINSWLAIPSSQTAEIIANLGFDAATIDMQHGMTDFQTAFQMLQGISTSKAIPMVRLPWNDPQIIMKILDAGAYGVICPMISTAQQAQEFINSVRYPPVGRRSWGPVRASIYGGEDYFENANEEILALALIETKEGVENINSILDTPGIDGVYVGTVDLSISLGMKELGDVDDPVLRNAIKTILKSVKKRNMVAGVHVKDPQQTDQLVKLGFNMVTPVTEIRLMASASKAKLEETRNILI